MKAALLLLAAIACLLLACSEDELDEVVSAPARPEGPAEAEIDPGAEATFWTGGSVSSEGHEVEYRFDLDAGNANRYTAWGSADTVTASWPDAGRYVVKAQARCSVHQEAMSPWSAGLTVAVGVESVTRPIAYAAFPQPDSFCTDGATSSRGHDVEYLFEFSELDTMLLTSWDTTRCATLPWSYTIGGVLTDKDYWVRARARCVFHTEAVSDWSDAFLVTPVDKRPEIRFTVHIDGVSRPYTHRDVPIDTVSMRGPFSISYHGVSENGPIRGYYWFPLSSTIDLPGARMWTGDTSDTLRVFDNSGDNEIPPGVFRFAARCVDDANAESGVNAGNFADGVCQVVVNFDPDTRFTSVWNNYFAGGQMHTREIDFADGVPDTVPYRSWVRMSYQGWDDARDDKICDPLDPDRCIDFQVRYERISARIPGSIGTSGWIPRGGTHDTDPSTAADSNSLNIGSLEYDLFVRAIDENSKPDGTPPRVSIVGNYDPTLDVVSLEDHFGVEVDTSIVDTLTWNFWRGIGWPYTSMADTVDITDPEFPFVKRFSWRLRASGHDHPLELDGSGIKAWRYLIVDDVGNSWSLARAGETWVEGAQLNELDDTFEMTFRYPGLTSPEPDHNGDTVFDNLPAYLNRDLTVMVMGRDTGVSEPEFEQFVFLNGAKTLINSYPVSPMGRWTEERTFTFHFRMIR